MRGKNRIKSLCPPPLPLPLHGPGPAMTSSSTPSRKVPNPNPPTDSPPSGAADWPSPRAIGPEISDLLFLIAWAWAWAGAEQDRLQPAAEGTRRVAGRLARRLQVQGLRQPPKVGDRGGRRRGHALSRQDVPAAGRLPRALPHGGTPGHFSQPGANAPAHLQQRAHLLSKIVGRRRKLDTRAI
ncbi:hypothetical protein D1007_14284 [Hordeum vulgare]|nr:hypothetical protein D1007_14284 [Hordeum vulgare]